MSCLAFAWQRWRVVHPQNYRKCNTFILGSSTLHSDLLFSIVSVAAWCAKPLHVCILLCTKSKRRTSEKCSKIRNTSLWIWENGRPELFVNPYRSGTRPVRHRKRSVSVQFIRHGSTRWKPKVYYTEFSSFAVTSVVHVVLLVVVCRLGF